MARRKQHSTEYKVHLTETCDPEGPHLITHVETTHAPVGDHEAVEPIHEALEQKELLPSRHLVDTGYIEAKLLVTAPRQYGVDLYGPARCDGHWQSKAGRGFDAGSFQIDWDRQEATCPEGKRSLSWSPAIDDRDNEVIKIKFSRIDCKPCLSRAMCTTAKLALQWEGQDTFAACVNCRRTESGSSRGMADRNTTSVHAKIVLLPINWPLF